jgi:hypothetical protein
MEGVPTELPVPHEPNPDIQDDLPHPQPIDAVDGGANAEANQEAGAEGTEVEDDHPIFKEAEIIRRQVDDGDPEWVASAEKVKGPNEELKNAEWMVFPSPPSPIRPPAEPFIERKSASHSPDSEPHQELDYPSPHPSENADDSGNEIDAGSADELVTGCKQTQHNSDQATEEQGLVPSGTSPVQSTLNFHQQASQSQSADLVIVNGEAAPSIETGDMYHHNHCPDPENLPAPPPVHVEDHHNADSSEECRNANPRESEHSSDQSRD